MKEQEVFKEKTLWDIVNNLLVNKKYDPSEIPELNTYIVTRAISKYPDCILLANAVNGFHNKDPERIYDFFFYSIPKKKRFAKWFKPKYNEKVINLLITYFKVSRPVAISYISLFNEKQINDLLTMEGGIK